MRFYYVQVDPSGAYVDSGTSRIWSNGKVNWIVLFHSKEAAQAYVAYLNQNFTIEQLKGFGLGVS